MKILIFFMGIFSLLLISQKNLCHIIWTWKKYPKNIPNNYVIFQLVGDGFYYENKLH